MAREPRRSPIRGKKRVGIDPNYKISRHLLALAIADVRKYHSDIKVGRAWVHTSDRRNWEFHGPDKFVAELRASNGFEARYRGWVAWLTHMRTKGYTNDETVAC